MPESKELCSRIELSLWEKMIVKQLCAVVSSKTKFLAELTPDYFPTTRDGWVELTILVGHGPMKSEAYYLWASAIVGKRHLKKAA